MTQLGLSTPNFHLYPISKPHLLSDTEINYYLHIYCFILIHFMQEAVWKILLTPSMLQLRSSNLSHIPSLMLLWILVTLRQWSDFSNFSLCWVLRRRDWQSSLNGSLLRWYKYIIYLQIYHILTYCCRRKWNQYSSRIVILSVIFEDWYCYL